MERERLILTKEQARDIVNENYYLGANGVEHEFNTISDEIEGSSRWSYHHTIIVKRKSDGKFFRAHYSVGATENQDERPFEYSDPIFDEVFPVEKTTIVYE